MEPKAARIVVVGAGQAGASLVAKLRALGHAGPAHAGRRRAAPPLPAPAALQGLPQGRDGARAAVPAAGELLRGRRHHPPHRHAGHRHRPRRPAPSPSPTAGVLALRPPRARDRQHAAPPAGRDRAAISAASFSCGRWPTPTRSPPPSPGARRALIVGGGYIGLEAAAVLREKGLEVTLLEAAPRILARVAAPATADYFRDLHAGRGVVLREGAALVRLVRRRARERRRARHRRDAPRRPRPRRHRHRPEDRARRRRPASPSTTASPPTAKAAPPIRRSSPPGDAASFPWNGERLRLESVPHAIDHAEAVAAAMLGGAAPYHPRPWFWSDQYDVKLQIAGLNAGWDRTVVRPGARPGSQSVWYWQGPRLLAVDAMNDPRAYMTAKRWIEAGVSPDAARDRRPRHRPQGALTPTIGTPIVARPVLSYAGARRPGHFVHFAIAPLLPNASAHAKARPLRSIVEGGSP